MIEHDPATPQPVSKIFELRQAGADTNAIVEQLFFDEYQSGVDDPELRYIGLRTLVERSSEGESALRYITKDTGRLGDIGRRMVSEPPRTMEELERLVGLQRYYAVVEAVGDVRIDAMKMMTRGYEFGQQADLIAPGLTFSQFIDQFLADNQNLHQGNIDKVEFMSTTLHFRAMAPIYYDMLDFDEVHRLQLAKQPRLVLLGAHKPSADGFDRFAESINPTADRRVIELNPEFEPMGKLKVDQGTALQMPYADASVDQVYTNALLHRLIDESGQLADSATVRRLFAEIYRVLKPRGQCLLVERPYGPYHQSYLQENQAGAFAELRRLAAEMGFDKKYDSRVMTRFMFRKQEGTSRVSRHGLAYHPNALLYRGSGELLSLRLEKPVLY